MKKITLAQFRKAGIATDNYRETEIQSAIQLLEEVTKFHPAELFIEVSEEKGKQYYEHPTVILTHPELKLTINKGSKGRKTYYTIYCGDSIRELTTIDYHEQRRVKELNKLVEPNTIGVLNANKILAWVNYYETYVALLKKENDGNQDERTKFLESLKLVEKTTGKKIEYWNNGTSGRIVHNGIELTFQIAPTYISQNVKVHYSVTESVSNFLTLSDNKYKTSKKV